MQTFENLQYEAEGLRISVKIVALLTNLCAYEHISCLNYTGLYD